MSDELKPCPFCGGEARIRPQRDTFAGLLYDAECCTKDCAGTIINQYTPEVAAAHWNRRAELSRPYRLPPELVERINNWLHFYEWENKRGGDAHLFRDILAWHDGQPAPEKP